MLYVYSLGFIVFLLPYIFRALSSIIYLYYQSVQLLSHVWLCDPMDCSTRGLPVPHQLQELAQCDVHRFWWCHPTISSSVARFSSCLQSFPASGSFPGIQFLSGGQSIGVSASASVLPMNIQDWFPLGLTGLISLQSRGLSRIFSNTAVQKHQFFGTQLSLWSSSHIHLHDSWKNHSFDYIDLVGKVMSLLFNTLSRLVIAFLPRNKHLFNFMAAVTICSDSGAQENKVCHCCLFSLYLFAMKWWDWIPWS